MIARQPVDTLKALYRLMARTRDVRADIVHRLLTSQVVGNDQVDDLKNALDSLEDGLANGYRARLRIDLSKTIDVDLGYEVKELRKDLYYLENGEDQFSAYLERQHPDFASYLKTGVSKMKEMRFNCFITDRDGTTNNYCGRYATSTQSIYNALFLTRFAQKAVSNPIMITSAPLKNIGVVDVSTMPAKTFILAASKGREFIDLAGVEKRFPIDSQKQDLINRLGSKLNVLVQNSDYEKFSLIGSGLQVKFGQITIARQDINGSIAGQASQAFLALIESMVKELDPGEENFRIEDTGLDIEIILTISDEKAGLKDFDKADGIKYLASELKLNMSAGPHLVCGDTPSDLPMLEAAMEKSKDTHAIFVTRKTDLAERVKAICPNALTVPEPDMLVAILNQLALTQSQH